MAPTVATQAAHPVQATITSHVTLGLAVYAPVRRPPFLEDLKYSLLRLVKERVKAATALKAPSKSYFFQPKPERNYIDGKPDGKEDDEIEPDGCWCDDTESPYTHNWTNCPNLVPIFDIDKKEGKLQVCRHGLLPPSSHLEAHWFCFQPVLVVMSYMAWLTAQPAVDLGKTDPSRIQQIHKTLQAYHSRVKFDTDAAEQAASADEQAELIHRFLKAMRLNTRPESERHKSWIEEHQIRRLLKWDDETFESALDELQRAIVAVKFDRLNPVVADLLDNRPKPPDEETTTTT